MLSVGGIKKAHTRKQRKVRSGNQRHNIQRLYRTLTRKRGGFIPEKIVKILRPDDLLKIPVGWGKFKITVEKGSGQLIITDKKGYERTIYVTPGMSESIEACSDVRRGIYGEQLDGLHLILTREYEEVENTVVRTLYPDNILPQ